MRDTKAGGGNLGRRNVLLAVVAGVIAAATILVWGIPGLDPSMWDEVCVAAKLRSPRMLFPGLWRVLTTPMFAAFGVSGACAILKILGAVVLGALTALTYLIIRQVLALLVRTSHPFPVWYRRIAPFFSFVGALLFGISDPVWRISRVFSPDQLRFAIFIFIIYTSLRWFVCGGRWRLFPVMALMGVFTAESPFGFILPLVFMGFYISVIHCVIDGLFPHPEKLPTPSELPKWRMFFLFLGGLAVGAWVNVGIFAYLGGIEANGWEASYIYFLYGWSYWRVFAGAASILGWLLALGFCVIPFVVALCIFPRLCRDDRPMAFRSGALMFFVGSIALMQSGAFMATRFWMFSQEFVRINSGFLLAFFVFCAIVTVSLFGALFAFECQRVYLTDEDDAPAPGILLRGVTPFVACLVVLMAFYYMPQKIESEMQRIVDEALAETVEESKGAKWIFTDGLLDAGLEIEAARQGVDLRPLNMMSSSDAWDLSVQSRGFKKDSEEFKAIEVGVPTLLRIWAGEKEHGLDEAALQLGFDLWKRERKALPPASGLVARDKWPDAQSITNGIRNAEALTKRILALAPKMENADPSPSLANAYSAVTWRLSRMARLRQDAKLADELDLTNTALKHMLNIVAEERKRTFMKLTPKEGLEIALKRANFAEAQNYAAAVLRYDSDDPYANFGMGMYALSRNRMADAERYLQRCLKRRPKEPAVLNNLSIIYRKQRKYKEAEEYARKAIEILPDSPEVKKTLEDALKKAP